MNPYERCARLAEEWAREHLGRGTPHTAEILRRFAGKCRSLFHGIESPAAGMARAVLENPEDHVTILIFMDCVSEWLSDHPDAQREPDRLAAEVLKILRDGMGTPDSRRERAQHLLNEKLCQLGYRRAVDLCRAIDTYFGTD